MGISIKALSSFPGQTDNGEKINFVEGETYDVECESLAQVILDGKLGEEVKGKKKPTAKKDEGKDDKTGTKNSTKADPKSGSPENKAKGAESKESKDDSGESVSKDDNADPKDGKSDDGKGDDGGLDALLGDDKK
jgi:hypothetical protein